MLSSPNACLIARVFLLLIFFPRDMHKIYLLFVGSFSESTQLRELLYTDSQDTLVLSSTVASRYYNWCTDGSISPGNYGNPLLFK
jgi:hypothetical protein